MRIEKLRLKGWTGIKKGLGLDSIEVDFSNISGLVAFEGLNGCGKSTCLELMSAYPRLASRDGAFFHHVCRRDAERELTFSYNGHSYRTLIKIDCDSEKQEGFVWKDGVSEITGKISEYNKYIKNLLGSPELFYSSVFCGQNSAKLSDMTTGQLKSLFAEFLRLDRLTEYETTAKQCGNVLSGAQIGIEGRCRHLQTALAGKQNLQNDLTATTEETHDLEKRREDLKQQAWTLSNRIDDLKEIAAQNAVNLQRKQDLLNSLERHRSDIAAEKTSCDRELTALREEYNQTALDMDHCNQILMDREAIGKAAALEKEIKLSINNTADEIELLTAQAAIHQAAIHAMEMAHRDLQESAKALNDDPELREIKECIGQAEAKIKEREQAVKDIENDFEAYNLETQIKALEEKADILKLKDPSCQSKTCAFITNALEAAEKLPEIRRKLIDYNVKRAEAKAVARAIIDDTDAVLMSLVKQRIERLEVIESRKAEISAKIAEAETALSAEMRITVKRNETLAGLRRFLADAKTELEKQTALSAKLPQVQIAEERKADLEKRRQEITEKGTALKSAYVDKARAANQRIDEAQKAIVEVEDLIDLEAEAKLKSAAEAKLGIESFIPKVEAQIQETRDKLSRLQGELARMAETEEELATLQSDRESLTREISEWSYLRNACSKNGLQALEIDGAAPLITSFANDLLSQAFGPLFTVRLRTQDDEGKEVLDIVVIMEDGSEVLLDNLSGGQKVWILMALRLAMTLLSKEKSGRNFETALFDELDGPLDPDNSLNFIGMYKAFMGTGGFSMVPFISHKPECRNMADNVLRFEYGKNPVWG